MEDWFFSRITDYWDNRDKNSIFEHSQVFRKYSVEEKSEIITLINKSITKHFSVLSNEQLMNVAWIIADDMYKSVNEFTTFDESISEYLYATAGTFFDLFKDKGYSLHYLTNNTFSDLLRPLHIFRKCFMAANLQYICPQEVALYLMKQDGIGETEYYHYIDRYIKEAEELADQIIDRCNENGDSYFYLYIDGDNEKFLSSLETIGKAGIITAIRTEAPKKGTACELYFPE